MKSLPSIMGGFSTPIFDSTPKWLFRVPGSSTWWPTHKTAKHHVLVNPWPACRWDCTQSKESMWTGCGFCGIFYCPKNNPQTKTRFLVLQGPTSHKGGYDSYKWGFLTPVTNVIMPFRRVITRFKTRRRHSCIFLSLVDFGDINRSIPLTWRPWIQLFSCFWKFSSLLEGTHSENQVITLIQTSWSLEWTDLKDSC